ncbi:hypothetical protein CA54_55950 [Symmachiella macrocystis]|uniref:Uncharacterized protein n=1 Tax=Symmachiella macrocystis TaxID=2527985 RepID=A0A5C6B5H1_9PLAN|nr:hypothetical protein CA54_55950 [Symmachiella macrocystis]
MQPLSSVAELRDLYCSEMFWRTKPAQATAGRQMPNRRNGLPGASAAKQASS